MLKTQITFYIILIILLFYEVNAIESLWDPEQIVHDFKPLLVHSNPVKKSVEYRKASEEPDTLPPCNDDELMVHLAELRAINPESIINLSTEDDLGTMCTQVSDALDRVDEFLRTCTITNQKDLYIQLIKGVDTLWDYLCNGTSHRMDFLKYYPCYHNLHDEYAACHGPADWNEYQQGKKVCNVYKEITDCFYVKTAKLCGLNAARIMKDLMRHVIDSILTVRCDVSKNPIVPDPMPESAGICTVSVYTFIMTAFLIIINLSL